MFGIELILVLVCCFFVNKHIKHKQYLNGLPVNIDVAELKEGEEYNGEDKPLEVKIKKGGIDVSALPEWKIPYKAFEFRPKSFDEFIGQEKAKEDARTLIKQAKRGMKAHFFMTCRPGMGKTTFVNLFGNELNATVFETTGSAINEDNIVDMFKKIHDSKTENNILFIDEIDSCSQDLIKSLNTAIEQFKLGGKALRPFIFAGATINKDKLIIKNPDFLDRISTHIRFIPYTKENIEKIIKQVKKNLYPDEKVEQNVYEIISKNCKYNPRIALGLLDKFIVEQDINKVLSNRQIVKDGLTIFDIKILKVLNNSPKAIGANNLALQCGLNEKEYTREYEPYLQEYNYIKRIPSRIIAEKGKNILDKLKGEA